MQFELTVQRVPIERGRTVMMRLIFEVCVVVVEALEPISNSATG